VSAGDDVKPAKGLRDLEDIDAVLGALAHPTRRHILQVLVARGGTLTAGELSARFAHSWPTTKRHLGVLLNAGVVSVVPVGRERHYQIQQQRLGDVLALWLRSIGFELRPLCKPMT
jgi:DNA-binding transcriptional ArsR family regulator